MIRGVDANPPETYRINEKKAPEPGGAAGGRAGAPDAPVPDRVTLGSRPVEAAYRKPAMPENGVEARLRVLRDLVARTFEKQGLSTTIDIGSGATAKIEEITPGQAKELVSDEGYWGVKKTAQRIFDFAVSAAGNDPSRLDAIREGIRKGFSMAEEGYGAALPEISHRTLDEVMAKLDRWAQERAEGEASPAGPAVAPG